MGDHGKHPHRAEKNIHPIQSDKQQPFIHFAKTERAKLKEVMRNLTFAEASSTLGQIWNNAPEEKRKPHLDWEVKDRTIYNGKRHHGEKIIQSSARSERSELSPQNPNTSLANRITQQKRRGSRISGHIAPRTLPPRLGKHLAAISPAPSSMWEAKLCSSFRNETRKTFESCCCLAAGGCNWVWLPSDDGFPPKVVAME